MDEKLEQLQINKLIQEFSFLKSDEELKKELIEHHQNIFLDLVNEELSNLSPDQIKDPDNTIKEPKSVKVESKIDMSTVSENTKVKIKKIYREIVKKTHPDKVNSEELNELYIQEELYLKVPLTSIEKKKFILKNKNVLVYTQSSNKYGELFARYILSMIFSPQNSEYSLPDNFYDEIKIFDFLYDGNQNVKPFNEWNNLLKYWIVYV
jgi:hypothetical protein